MNSAQMLSGMPEPGHALGPHVDDRGDVVGGTENGRKPRMIRLTLQSCCPRLTPVHSRIGAERRVGGPPSGGVAPSTQNPASMMNPAGTASQNEAMLSRGNAMSAAPILSGMR